MSGLRPFRGSIWLGAAAALAVCFGPGEAGRFAEARPAPRTEAPSSLGVVETVKINTEPGETVRDALIRTGLDPVEAHQAYIALGEVVDVVNVEAMFLEARLLRGPDGSEPRLQSLKVRAPTADPVVLSRSAAGFSTRVTPEPVQMASHPRPQDFAAPHALPASARDETAVVEGPMEEVLYGSATELGASPAVINKAVRLLAHKIDFSRDLRLGDHIRIAFKRSVGEDGQVLATGELLYAEVRGRERVVRFYRFQPPAGGAVRFLDDGGRSEDAFLLKTPIKDARVTSRFGLRLHPLLGYTRLHRGVDFGAPQGTPVVAAGDGVIESAAWSGGYGRLIQLRHGDGLRTRYAHLSAFADDLRAGSPVKLGQVIGFVGTTGMSTGPHLHFEVVRNGSPVDPQSLQAELPYALDGLSRAAFQAQRREIEVLLANRSAERLRAEARPRAPATVGGAS